MTEKDELINIGLSNREADTYLALLQLQEATVKDIAEKTKESRTHLYDTLKNLIKKGLVSYVIKNDVKYFHPAPPEKLVDYLREKESSFLAILPALLNLHQPHTKKPTVEVYEGAEGMKTILNDIIRTKQIWMAIGSTGKGPQILSPIFVERFHRDRIRNKVNLKVLCNSTAEGRSRAREFNKYGMAEVKFLPKSHQSPATIYIYGNKTAIFMWLAGGDKPFAILIENEEISKSFKSYFNLLWALS